MPNAVDQDARLAPPPAATRPNGARSRAAEKSRRWPSRWRRQRSKADHLEVE